MKLIRLGAFCDPARWRAACALFVLGVVLPPAALAQVWWDNFPRIVSTSSLSTAQAYGANAAMNGVSDDPGWGLWFTFGDDNGAGNSSTRASFQAAGIVSLSYNETFGQPVNPIDELQWSASLQRWTTANQFWSWQSYGGGTIVWAGAWSWFDSFTNDLPANKSEFSYFARPYTRMNATYGGGPMLYPNGTIATGFLNNDTTATNPCNSRVYDAGGSKTIYGSLLGDGGFSYNSLACSNSQVHTGMIWIPADGKYSGLVTIGRDTACPCWSNYTYASTLAAVQLTGLQGSWSDNFSSWDSFMANEPVSSGFGEWSVALFQNYLTNNFTTNQLASWGVLAASAPLSAITNFDVRAYLLTVASNQFNLRTTSLSDGAWTQTGWQTNPVWCAFKIFRRQNGTAALANYDQAVHTAAVQAGQTNFALLANDQLPAMGGWARGTLDLASTELSLNWNLTAGPRGFGLPPFARLSPVYKAVREQGRSHFANIWLYNGGYASALTNSGPALSLFYEMLATHTTPLFIDGQDAAHGYTDNGFVGTSQMQSNFMTFVARSAAPAFANRVPIEEVGIYLSTSSILSTWLPGDAENFANQYHQYAVWGWGTALSQLHSQYRIVPEWKLNNSGLLQGLKVLIIPNAEAFEPADVATLQIWVTNGGCLIVTGDSGSLLGESGNFAPTNNLLLASLTGVTNFSTAPVLLTNFLGSGAVYYYSNNVGYAYYNTDTAGRAAQLPTFGTALTNAYAFLHAQPVLASSNAPTTAGLTLYQNPSAFKTFVDVNNFNVGTDSPYAITNTPPMEVDVARPGWLTNGLTPMATIVSPDGSLSVSALSFDANRVYLQLPSVTNYMSVILQPARGMGAWGVDASGNWGDTNNWSNFTVPGGISATAIFSNNITGDRFVTNDAQRTVGNLVFGDADSTSAGGWTITGTSALYLQVSNGTPVISMGALAAGKTVTIAAPLAGNQGLALNCTGTVRLSIGNVYFGATTVSNGTLLVNGATISPVTVASGAELGGSGTISGSVTLNSGALALFTEGSPLRISGATGCWSYFTVKALYKLGRVADARKIFHPMLQTYASGEFQGFGENGMSRDWRDWSGGCHGYEGLLVDNYLALLAVMDDWKEKP